MRKLIAIPLLVLYITAVSGMMVQLHFCGSKLLSWNVNKAKTVCCCEPKAQNKSEKVKPEKDENCCKDKTITLKIKQDQNRGSQFQLQLEALQTLAIAACPAAQIYDLIQTDVQTAYQSNAPPGLWQNIPLYKLHARFTYYG